MARLIIELLIIGAWIAGMWRAFEKAGRPGWESVVPFYNFYILTTKIVGRPVLWFVCCLIPLVGLIPAAIICVDVAKSFGKTTGFGIGLLLLGFVFWPILGFGEAQYARVAPAAIGVGGGVPAA